MVRILIADDHEMVRQGLRQTIEGRKDWQICGEASTGREAVEAAKKLVPDLIILDFGMPELNGLEATRQIKKTVPNTEILVFTMHETAELTHALLKAGARGYLLKSDAASRLVEAVEALSKHNPYFTWSISKTMLAAYLSDRRVDRQNANQFDELTPREREIVQLLAEGHSNKAVSTLLGISVKTTETHRAAIMRKLGISSIVELVRYAIRNSIIQP